MDLSQYQSDLHTQKHSVLKKYSLENFYLLLLDDVYSDNPNTFYNKSKILEHIEYAESAGYKTFVYSVNLDPVYPDRVAELQNITDQASCKLNFKLLCGSVNVAEEYEKFFNQGDFKFKFDVLNLRMLEDIIQEIHASDMSFYDNSPAVRHCDKYFISLNRTLKYHRLFLLCELYEQGLLDKSFTSFGVLAEHFVDKHNVHPEISNMSLFEKYQKTFNNLSDILPLIADFNAAEQHPGICINESELDMAKQSYFTVVTETVFFDNNIDNTWGLFISEKTFKPILSLHPFVLLAKPFTLAKLREYGYKTFYPWINEEYDTITDDEQRLKCVFSEISRLCNLSHKEWRAIQQEMSDVVNHNFNHIKTVWKR